MILGVAGTVVGLASEGLRLCQTLDLYCEKVKYSEKEVQGIAHDIRDTAVVLEQLGANIKLEEELLSKLIVYSLNPLGFHLCRY